MVGRKYQRSGYGREGALAMASWLRENGVDGFVAHIHPAHDASAAIAQVLGLVATATVTDGEIRWSDRG